MRITSLGILSTTIISAGLALSARAEEAKVATGADSMTVGGEFRAELNRNDQGLTKYTGNSPDATTTLGVLDANLKLDGKLNKDTEYHFRFNLLNPLGINPAVGGVGYPTDTRGPLDYGYGLHWFNSMIGFSMGKERVMQGGWVTIDDSYRDRWTTAFEDDLAYYEFDYAAAVHVKFLGEVVIQMLNDKVQMDQKAPGYDPMLAGQWGQTQHPTVAVAWLGSLGPVSPMIDAGWYDQQKSHWIDVGVKTELAGLEGGIDVHYHSIDNKVGVTGETKVTDAYDTTMAYTVNLAYDVKHIFRPWAFYSTYNKKEYSDQNVSPQGQDVDFNPAQPNTYSLQPSFADNKNVWALGVDLGMLGKNWTPYLAYVSTSGKFQDPGKNNETATRTQGEAKLGVLGGF